MSNLDLWDRRYTHEGEIWQAEPSLTAKFISQNVSPQSSILEIGFGYGRDIAYLAQKGYQVTGIEHSAVGCRMATARLCTVMADKPPLLIQGNFLDAVLPKNTFDVVYAHRVIHLLEDEYSVDAYQKRVAEIVNNGGLLLASARDPRGVKPQRKGHHVSFWDAKRFEKVFGKDFTIEHLIEGEEIESVNNPVPTYFTLMVARRKPYAAP